jgi:hypothetical protein
MLCPFYRTIKKPERTSSQERQTSILSSAARQWSALSFIFPGFRGALFMTASIMLQNVNRSRSVLAPVD